MTKSHIPTVNTPTRNDVHVGQLTNESKIRLKRGRLVGSNDVTPQKRRTQEKLGILEEENTRKTWHFRRGHQND